MTRFLRILGTAVLTVAALQFAGAADATVTTFGCANNKCDGAYRCTFAGFNTCCIAEGGGACTTYDCMVNPDGCP